MAGVNTKEKLYDELVLCEGFENSLKLQKKEVIVDAVEKLMLMAGYWNLRESRRNETKELQVAVSNLKSELNKLDSYEHELEETLQQRTDVKSKNEEKMLRKEVETLQAICENQKKNIECLHEGKKPHENDIAILEKNRKRMKLYKDFTGIKWDFIADPSYSAGIVFNPIKHYIKRFSYSGEEKDKVWNEMENAVLSETSSQKNEE